ncbi:MAG: hypothetical protein LBE31_08900 [Deltaproteobacteria bacterium]|jgi:uncharacterized membrane protein|nr:hypothetical protein [Deltaproteobacteria bacterium]
MSRVKTFFVISLAIVISIFTIRAALAQEHSTPFMAAPYDLEAAFVYQGQVISPEDSIELEISLVNRGYKGETFNIEVTNAPSGWTTQIRRFNTILSGIYLVSEETAALTLAATPPDYNGTIPLGNYDFTIKISGLISGKTVECQTTLLVTDSKISREALTLTTSYPEIFGPSDGRFSFSLEIRNNSPEDALVNLTAQAPKDWDASFKPGYEDKQISSIQVPKGQSRTVSLDLTPAFQAEAGSYQVKVKAEQPSGSAETELTVNLTGTYKIRALTTNELLSLTAEVGRPVTVSIFVINDGSANQQKISFLAVKPDNWEVTFSPQTIGDLPPRSNPVEVSMTVTPAPNALVGDYALGLNVQGEKAQSALDFRVTVKASTTMAWLGAALIILAVAALAWTFRRLGRR